MSKKKASGNAPPESIDTPFRGRLEEADLVEAVQLLLAKRRLTPSGKVGYFRWRFGLNGDPQIVLVGDAVDIPNAGKPHVVWSYELLDNVEMISKNARRVHGGKEGA